MTIKEKLKSIDKISDIFTIKLGKMIRKNNKCFKAENWYIYIFRFYYGGLFLFPLFFLLNNSLFQFNSIFYKFIESIIMLIILEFILVLVTPMSEVSCYEGIKKDLK